MTLRLMGLRLDSDGAVIADLDSGTQSGRVTAKFDLGQGADLILASPQPDVFAEFASSIEEIRQITSAVIAFSVASHAARGE